MAFALSSANALAGKTVASKATVRAQAKRTTVVASAGKPEQAATRRQAIGFLAAAAATVAGKARAELATPPELQNDIQINKDGLQFIYEARDLDLDAKPRGEGATRFALQKLTIDETKARAAESLKRIETDIPPLVEKKYWIAARNELRRQVGFLRFDLNNIATSKGAKTSVNKEFFTKLEVFDLALRQKDQDAAKKALPVATTALKELLA